jgi:hypothetical protein
MRRRAEIIVETEEVLVVRKSRFTQAWREKCGESVALITDEDAATLTGASLDLVRQRARAGELHSTEMADGQLIICLEGLFQKL